MIDQCCARTKDAVDTNEDIKVMDLPPLFEIECSLNYVRMQKLPEMYSMKLSTTLWPMLRENLGVIRPVSLVICRVYEAGHWQGDPLLHGLAPGQG